MTDDLPGPSPSSKTAFISYARADRPRVAPIAAALHAGGYDVWWDAMIDGGAEFAKTIENKLASADAVLVVWSKTSVGSDWVRDEAAYARDRKRLVPLSLDGTEAPLGFRQYHAIDLSKWAGGENDAEMGAVLRGVAAVAGGGAIARAGDLPAPSSRPSRRTLLIGGGAAVTAAAAVIGSRYWPTATDSSVAVLPFANLSGDPGQAYFSDGLSEEVRAALARIAQLKVAAPTSSAVFRALTEDAQTIGAKLGVGYLLEGSVRKSGDVMRIAANLIDAKSGFSSWSQTFDRKLTDVFAVQGEIANTVAEALSVRVAGTQAFPGGTKNVAAYDAFLRGREFYNADAGEESDRAALARFDAALALDPRYASAHAARSRSLADVASGYAKASELRSMYDASIAAARTSIAIAPELAIGYWALGNALFYGKLDPRAAREGYDRAYELGKGDADVGIAFAHFCVRTGRTDDASAAIARALTLDALNARAYRAAGLVASVVGDLDKAMAHYRHALELNPKLAFVRSYLGAALLQRGKPVDARAAFADEPNEMMKLTGLAIVDHKLGDVAGARDAMQKIVQTMGDAAIYQQADVLAQWGDSAGAMAALERARVIGDSGLTFLLIDPMLTPLRTLPAFSNLLKNIGFA